MTASQVPLLTLLRYSSRSSIRCIFPPASTATWLRGPMLRRGLLFGPNCIIHLRAAESACSSSVRGIGSLPEAFGAKVLGVDPGTPENTEWSTYTVGVSAPDGENEPAADPIRCLMLGRVRESVWKGLILKTIGTMSSSTQRRVQRFGACTRPSAGQPRGKISDCIHLGVKRP